MRRRKEAFLRAEILRIVAALEAASLRQEPAAAAEALVPASASVEPPAAATLPTICAWCPDFDPQAPANAGSSHGICPACVERFQ